MDKGLSLPLGWKAKAQVNTWAAKNRRIMTPSKPQPTAAGYQMNLASTPNARLTDLAKMRSKLATAKPKEVIEAEARQQNRIDITAKSLGYGFAAGAMLLLVGLICWAALVDQGIASETRVEKGIPKVKPPAQSQTVDEQTLYWAYALYDWNKFVETYKVPRNTLVDTRKAQTELERLLPKASGLAQFTVMKYRNQVVRRL